MTCRGLIERRRFPPPWTLEQQAACFVVRDHNGQVTWHCSCFVDIRRLLANIRLFAGRCGLVSVLNGQAPRLSRRIFCLCVLD